MQYCHMVQVHGASYLQLLTPEGSDESWAVGGQPQLADFHGGELVEHEADATPYVVCVGGRGEG